MTEHQMRVVLDGKNYLVTHDNLIYAVYDQVDCGFAFNRKTRVTSKRKRLKQSSTLYARVLQQKEGTLKRR